MSDVEPGIIERSVEKAHIWLKELAGELGVEDRRYRIPCVAGSTARVARPADR